MKLDKIKFAKVVSWISRITNDLEFAEDDLRELDELIDVNVPQAAPASMMNAEMLHVLMALMQEGTRKIEAIKQHRMMTGYGLKESKDIVDKYWRAAHKSEGATLGDILKTAERPPVNFDKFEG